MAVKLADTMKPMGDFPVAEAPDIDFEDGESLQEKFDNGSLGGSSSQKEELPVPTEALKGKVYQYVGESGTYNKGAFYECALVDGAYVWKTIDVAGVINDAKKGKDTTYSSEHIEDNFVGKEGESSDTVVKFTIPEEETDLETGDKLSILIGKIVKKFKSFIDDASTNSTTKSWSAKKINDSLVDKADADKVVPKITITDTTTADAKTVIEKNWSTIPAETSTATIVTSSYGYNALINKQGKYGTVMLTVPVSGEPVYYGVLGGSSWTWQELATMDNVGVNDDNPSITYSSADVTITVNKIINGIWYISGYTMRDIRDTDVVTINGYKFAFDKIFYGVDEKTNYYRCSGNKLQTSNVANDSCFGFHLPVVRA